MDRAKKIAGGFEFYNGIKALRSLVKENRKIELRKRSIAEVHQD